MEQVDHQVGIGIDLSTPSMACLGSNISERECADRLPIFFVVHLYIICFRCFVDFVFLCFLLLLFLLLLILLLSFFTHLFCIC